MSISPLHKVEMHQILLIEDNPGDVTLIKEHFKKVPGKFNFTVKTDGGLAQDYIQGFNSNNQNPMPHLIILDLNLPKVGGLELLYKIKDNTALSNVPVVVFSSSDAESDIAQAYSNHGNCYIVKPFEYDDYSRAVDGIIQFWFQTSRLPTTIPVAA